MKTRTDFVSNSSSSSFIVNDPVAFKRAVMKWSSDCAYELDRIELTAACKVEDKDLFPDSLTETGWEYDGMVRFKVTADDLLSVDDTLLSNIREVELTCDDFDTGNMFMLSVLKKALENVGVPVDSSKSEHPLLLEDDTDYDGNDFLRNICFAAFSDAHLSTSPASSWEVA